MFKRILYTLILMGTLINGSNLELTKKRFNLGETIIVKYDDIPDRIGWIVIYPEGHHHFSRSAWIRDETEKEHQFNPLPLGNYEVRLYSKYLKLVAKSKFMVEDTNTNLSNRKDFQLFGDPELNRIVGMQMSTMKQVFEIPLNGENIYSSDIINDEKSYAYGRASNKIFILKRDKNGIFSEKGIIPLPFAPRTGAKNRHLGLTLITGADKPMYAIINTNTDKVVATGGRDEVTQYDDSNHGSKWATGHGIWLTNTYFVVPDRESRELILYKIHSRSFKVEELNRMSTSSSIHTIIGKLNNKERIYYAVTEGSDSSRPSLVKFKLKRKRIVIKDSVKMPGVDLKNMTAHHAQPLPNGKEIYMGTSDGYLHIIDKKHMKVIKSIKAGKGAGHTTLIPQRNLALVTNHHDKFVTVINTQTHTKVKDIHVSNESIKNTALQSHTARISPDSKYYYNFATDNGYYFRIDLDRLKMDKTFYTGGTPKQASQPGEIN